MALEDTERDYRRYCLLALLGLAVLFGSVWLWVIKMPMGYLPVEYSIYAAKVELMKSGSGADLVIIGDSRPSAALIPKRLGPNVLNLAVPGESPIELYYLTKEFLVSPLHPKAVIISISPSLFTNSTYFWERSAKYGILSTDQINEVRLNARSLQDNLIFGGYSPGDIDARLKNSLYGIKFPPFYFSSLVNSGFYRRYGDNRKMLAETIASRGQHFFGTANGSTEPDPDSLLKSFDPSKVVDYYFDQMLALYLSRHIPIYFLAIPHNEASERLYFPGFRQAFTDYLNGYARRYPGFQILGDPFPSYPSRFFGDGAHLNEAGAERCSDYVAQLFNDSKVDGGPYGMK